MGQDGLLAAMRLHELGGQVVAQDEASSVVWGMPKAAVAINAADEVLPLDRIPTRLAELCRWIAVKRNP